MFAASAAAFAAAISAQPAAPTEVKRLPLGSEFASRVH
jgi:hypothetical protein